MDGRTREYYCQLLGIEHSASAEELKRAHRDMAQVWHPDRFAANPRLQRIAENKLREINQAYTVLRGGRGGSGAPAETPAWRPPAAGRWAFRGMQAVAAAAGIFGLILSASSLHRLLNEPPDRAIVAELSKGPEPENAQPAARRGRFAKTEDGQTSIANGTEIVEPRGRRGVGRVTITNQMDRDAVAMLVDSSSPDAVVRMVYVSAGRQVALDGIGPGMYRLQFSAGAAWNWRSRDFTWRRTASRMVGPLSFTQIQSTGQVRGDQYRIVLRHDGAGAEGDASDGTLRA